MLASWLTGGAVAQTPSASPQSLPLVARGSTLAEPVLGALSFAYPDKANITYSPTGSGDGIQSVMKSLVSRPDFQAEAPDFALSDVPLSQYDLADVIAGNKLNAAEGKALAQKVEGISQLPIFFAALAVAYHVDIGELKLPGDVLAKIMDGEITQWSDPQIAAANPQLKENSIELPNLPITLVVRENASGQTFTLTRFLSAAGAKIGVGKTTQWPQNAKIVRVTSTSKAVEAVKNTEGAIGYVPAVNASLNGLNVAAISLSPQDLPTLPSEKEVEKALTSWPFGNQAAPISPFPPDGYRLLVPELLLFSKEHELLVGNWDSLISFVKLVLSDDGQKAIADLGYSPLPVAGTLRTSVETILGTLEATKKV